MPKQQPERFVDAFADRPALARRGLLPGRRVFTSIGWAAAVATVVSVTGWSMGTVLSGDDGTTQTVAADRPQDPSPESESGSEPASASEPTTEEPEPEPEEEPTPEAEEQPEPAQEPPPPSQQQEEPRQEDDPAPEPEPEREERQEPETEVASASQGNMLPENVYRLMPGTHDDRCLDVDSSGTAAGTNVRQWECNGASAQNFALQLAPAGGPNTYRLVGIGGNCVDIEDGSRAMGANIRMWDCNGTASQRFRLEPNLNGYLLVSELSGHCVDVDDASIEWGANVRQWACNGTPAQTWRFESR